jgi:hypothetical protein
MLKKSGRIIYPCANCRNLSAYGTVVVKSSYGVCFVAFTFPKSVAIKKGRELNPHGPLLPLQSVYVYNYASVPASQLVPSSC